MPHYNLSNFVVHTHPYKYVVVSNVIEFPKTEVFKETDAIWHRHKEEHVENENYSKLELKTAGGMCGHLMDLMCGEKLNQFLQDRFPEMGQLTADPSFDGGGLTISPIGKFLRYHADFPYSNSTNKYRVLNALLYLSRPEIAGGELHLLDPESGTVEARIAPTFGTLAIFPTSSQTPHGVSRIFNSPRVSINSYFYAEKPLDDRVQPSKTEWL